MRRSGGRRLAKGMSGPSSLTSMFWTDSGSSGPGGKRRSGQGEGSEVAVAAPCGRHLAGKSSPGIKFVDSPGGAPGSPAGKAGVNRKAVGASPGGGGEGGNCVWTGGCLSPLPPVLLLLLLLLGAGGK